MKKFFFVVALLFAGSFCAWHFYFSPEAAKRRAVERVLAEMDAAVATQDRAKISGVLEKYLLPEARVVLNVDMAGGIYAQTGPMQETFNKPDFIRFIDLTLYSVNHYGMESGVDTLTPQKDGTAEVKVRMRAEADGDSYFNGFIMKSRFMVEGDCTGTASFDATGVPHLRGSVCHFTLRIAPKADAADFKRLRDSISQHQP